MSLVVVLAALGLPLILWVLVGDFMGLATPLVIGHRGCAARRPENTMASFAQAVAEGADMFELDVQLSADGVPVVMHDENLERTTDGQGKVWKRDWEVIQALDAGSWFGPEWAGEKVPSLAGVLEAFGGRVLINIELKPESLCRPLPGPAAVARVVSLVAESGLVERVLISSFSYDALRIARALAPEANLAVLGSGPENGADPVLLCRAIGAVALNPDLEHLARPTVERLHQAGLACLPYGTAGGSAEASMRKVLDLGCDGWFADDPAAWRRALGR